MSFLTKLTKLTALAVLLAAVSGQVFAQRGNAGFTRYVALGDSLTAGYASASLIDAHQRWGYPVIIARQAKAGQTFEQPLISEPGIPGELYLQSLVPSVVLAARPGNGVPLNLALPRPYNNLGVPGARTADLLSKTGAEASSNPYYQIILRGLGTPIAQAIALNPTFVSVWIGNNDVLGAVTSGTPAALTPLADFQRDYALVLDRLIAGLPNAGIITANVPDVTSVPFATTVPPVMVNPATSQPILGPNGQPIFLFADLGGGTLGQLPPGSQVTLGATSFLQTGYGIPPPIAGNFPQLPNAGKPLPDAVVLTPTELTTIKQRNADVNAAIASIAASRNIPVVDAFAVLSEYVHGKNFGGIVLSTAFLTGGVFSYDGIHPTDIGYSIVANGFIRRINESWGTRIPTASLTWFFSNNAPANVSSIPLDPMAVVLEESAWEHMVTLFGAGKPSEASEPVPAPSRRRVVKTDP